MANILNNIYSGLLGFLFAIFIIIGFGSTFENLINIADTEIRIFLGVIIVTIMTSIGFLMPIEFITQDDLGRNN